MSDGQILSHELENGLILVGEPIPGLESAAFSFLLPAGSRFSPQDRQGLAAFTCDMALRGAGSRDSREFLEALENLGVERSETVSNAHTCFGGATLAGNLMPALKLYADLFQRAVFPEDQLEASRSVVQQELAGIEDDPGQKVMRLLRARHYPDPLGRSSQGNAAGISAITAADVRSAYAAGYRPNGTILGVAGRFDWSELTDHVEDLFAAWKPVEPQSVQLGPIPGRLLHDTHASNQTQIAIAFASVPYRDPDYYQASGAIGVLSGGTSSRLFTEVREVRGLCYSVYATLHTLEDRGSVLCYAGTSSARAQETLDVTIAELLRLRDGVREDELARLKARIKSGLVMQQESSAARSNAIAGDWYHLRRSRTLKEIGAKIDALTCDSINGFLAEHPPGEFTIVTLGPDPLEVTDAVS